MGNKTGSHEYDAYGTMIEGKNDAAVHQVQCSKKGFFPIERLKELTMHI